MSKIFVPPIKCQGIKTKLIPLILQSTQWDDKGIWVEPFMGSGVVGFNVRPKGGIFADSNPHIINFYNGINSDEITPSVVRIFLETEGSLLSTKGKDHYYLVRERFNQHHSPLDFLFLNRAGFNGMIRFNQKGKFNIPFNHKPDRFSKAYVTKVVNQVKYVYDLCRMNDYTFVCSDFRETFQKVTTNDFVYCDPPYAGRHVDYFNSWQANDEQDLLDLLANCPSKFMLSTWHSNEYRSNTVIPQLEKNYNLITHEHFYHVGAKETNRNPMIEALVINFEPYINDDTLPQKYYQAQLLETQASYTPAGASKKAGQGGKNEPS